jgi:methylenetetrahydrofolate reductase (NADPH)
MTSVVSRLDGQGPAFSVEFFPPRDVADEAILWRSIRELEPYDPSYMSITYGAGGSTRQRTHRIVVDLLEQQGLRTLGEVRDAARHTAIARRSGAIYSRP